MLRTRLLAQRGAPHAPLHQEHHYFKFGFTCAGRRSTQPTQAQAFRVIYNFTGFSGGQDGGNPHAGVTIDVKGSLDGTTSSAGSGNAGTVFKLTPKGSAWVLTPLYDFKGFSDADEPEARVIFGPDGSLYGTTIFGGLQYCDNGEVTCGTVFNVRPTPTACKTVLCSWAETILYPFTGGNDGANPTSEVTFDASGNMYLPVEDDFGPGYGNISKLTPSNGGWQVSVLYAFTFGNDGANPRGTLILDPAGNLYGTARLGGNGRNGVVFQLTPSGSGWAENVLYTFQGGSDGSYPAGGVISTTWATSMALQPSEVLAVAAPFTS